MGEEESCPAELLHVCCCREVMRRH